MSNITQFPTKPVDPVDQMRGPELFGSKVIIDGHEVPNMWMVDRGETVELCFPGPVVYTFPREIAYHAAHACAKAMAVGAGYSHVSSEHAVTKTYGPKAHCITSVETE